MNIEDLEDQISFLHKKLEIAKKALIQILEREKPGPDNDPLGMSVVTDSYLLAYRAIEEIQQI